MPPEAIDESNLNSIDTEEQADALIESVERPDHAPIQESQAPAAPVDEWDLTVGGKPLKAKREQVIQWAQMGYDAPNKIRALTKEIDSWKQKESHFKTLESKYGEIDKFVQEKPDFWDTVVQQYQNRNQSLQDPTNPLASVVQQLQTQVQGLVQYKDQIEQQRSQALAQQEDQVYQQQFEEFRTAYPDIDFITPDGEGKSLEYKVLEHAQKEGIRNFKTAFRDFHHDELMKREHSRAKESVVKEKQKNTKLGILGISPTPQRRAQSTEVRSRSWDDIGEEAKRELGIN